MKIIVTLYILLGCTLWAAEPDLKKLLQTGLMAEEAEGDLVKAAGAYESLIQAGEGQQKIIATAIYRLAEVRRKQDKKEEAIQLYQRLVREFAGQELLVKLAKENLTTLGAKLPEGLSTFLTAADDAESVEIARMEKLLAESPDVARTEVPLHLAARNGWKRLAEAMIAKGFDVNRRFPNERIKEGTESELFLTPLAMSAKHGHKAVAELLLTHGADANDGLTFKDERTFAEKCPLMEALRNDRVEIAGMLLKRGAIVNFKVTVWRQLAGADQEIVFGTPLHLVVDKAALPLVKLLLEHHADVNAVTETLPNSRTKGEWAGETPLFYARNLQTVEMLIAAGAKVDARNQTGCTPLFFASVDRYYDNVTPLIKRGAAVNALDNLGRTPLMRSVANLEKAKVLMANGADPKLVDLEGNTLLHLAAAAVLPPETVALVQWLMSLPLDAAARNKAGKTALEIAQENSSENPMKPYLLARMPAAGKGVFRYQPDQPLRPQELYSPMAEDEPLPSLAEFALLTRGLEGNQRKANNLLPNVLRRRDLPSDPQAFIARPSLNNEGTEKMVTVMQLEVLSPGMFEPLLPGDVVETRHLMNLDSAKIVQPMLKKLGIKVIVSFLGVERQFSLGGNAPWHPVAPELPDVFWDGMLLPLIAGMDEVDLKRVKLIRTLQGKQLERMIDLESSEPAGWPRVMNGDRIELLQRKRNDPQAVTSGIAVTMPDLFFSYNVNVSGTETPSLVVGVAMHSVWGDKKSTVSDPRVLSDPRSVAFFARNVQWREGTGPMGRDWSQVTLWRAGQDKPEVFDLESAAARLEPDAGSRTLRAAEPELKAGDRIELPPKKGHENEPMSEAIFNYLQRILLPDRG